MSIQRILVPLDGSRAGQESIAHAIRLAQSCNGEVHLLHVLVEGREGDADHHDSVDWRLRWVTAQSQLEAIREQFSEQGVLAFVHVAEGRAAARIADFVRAHDVDLVILSAYGQGGKTTFRFGSTTHKVVSDCSTSILIVHPDANSSPTDKVAYTRVLIPLDGSYRAEWAACETLAALSGQQSEVVLLQVVPLPGMLRQMPATREEVALRNKFVEGNRRAGEEYLRGVAQQLQNGIRVRPRLTVASSVAREILSVANEEDVDLIAISAHGSGDDTGWSMSCISESVILHSYRPVLLLQDLPDTRPQRLETAVTTRQMSYSSPEA